MNRNRHLGPLAIGVIAVALCASCLGRSPTVRQYTLGQNATVARAASAPQLAVYVGPADFPRYLDRSQMVRRGAGGELEIDQVHRWAGGLEPNVLRALGDGLAERLGSERVIVYPAKAPFPIDRELTLDFQELVADAGKLRLRARWVIGKGQGDSAPRTGVVLLEREIAGASAGALVEAHDHVLARLADELAQRLAAPADATPTPSVPGTEVVTPVPGTAVTSD